MRQAGRYMPEYQKIRAKHDFETMYKTPELACEITLQPVKRYGPDAAIIFSDIMVIADALGHNTRFVDGTGPVLDDPVRSAAQIEKMRPVDPYEDIAHTLKAITLAAGELPDLPLIGFAGAPFTLAKYMVDGKNLKTGRYIKSMLYDSPDLLRILLDKISDAVIKYAKAQSESGADLIQLFDSSAAALSESAFLEYALPYAEKVVNELKKAGIPVIYFALGLGPWLEYIPRIDADVVSLDWTISPARARNSIPRNIALQGNLDPAALYADPQRYEEHIDDMIMEMGKYKNYIVNLGHGILPDIPVENVEKFVDMIKQRSSRIYDRMK
jgi:uroporphyrinogen decarboxylase